MIDQIEILIEKFGLEAIAPQGVDGTGKPVILVNLPSKMIEIAEFLQNTEGFYYDSLSNLTGIDNGIEKNTMEIVYHLYSIPNNSFLVLKLLVDRQNPVAPSLCSIWASANWAEREAFDMLGIKFTNHPDLRRILMPEDWQGYPLRKDYQTQEKYHGIKVDF